MHHMIQGFATRFHELTPTHVYEELTRMEEEASYHRSSLSNIETLVKWVDWVSDTEHTGGWYIY